MENKRVAVLLASYNGRDWIEEQLNSVFNQSGVDVHVYIRDDFSTDGTADFVESKFSKYLDRLTIYRPGYSSGGAGQNFIKLIMELDPSGYSYYAFCDQDDIWLDDKLISAISLLEKEGADGYSSSVMAFWPDGKKKIITQNSVETSFDHIFEGAGQGCTFVLSKKLFSEIRNFSSNNSELVSKLHYHDWLAYYVCRSINKKWVFDKNSWLMYRQHGGNDTGARASFAGVFKRLNLIKSGWYSNQVNFFISLAQRNKKNDSLDYFFDLWDGRSSLKGRVKLSIFLIKNSRRRLSDRLVLGVSCLIGWI